VAHLEDAQNATRYVPARIDRCLQIFGGYGYIREFPIARMFAAARVAKIYAGANEVMKELIARSL
jgi:acyl-CoA dehydrogenase